MVIVITIVVQGDAVELEEWVGNITTRCRQSAVQRHPLEIHRPRSGQVDTFAFFHITEVDGIDSSASVRNDGGLHVADQRPLSRPEEWMCFDIRSTSSGSQSPVFVFDE